MPQDVTTNLTTPAPRRLKQKGTDGRRRRTLPSTTPSRTPSTLRAGETPHKEETPRDKLARERDTPIGKMLAAQDFLHKLRWSLKDFIHTYLCEDAPRGSYVDSMSTRREKLGKALFGDDLDDPLEQQRCQSAGLGCVLTYMENMDQPLLLSVKQLVDDQASIRNNIPEMFGTANPIADPQTFSMEQALERLPSVAPTLWGLLLTLTKNRFRYGKEDDVEVVDHRYRIVTVIAILNICSARNSGNAFQRLLGLYLHGQGVKRHVLAVLKSIGISETYQTINSYSHQLQEDARKRIESVALLRSICVVWDNFEIMQRVLEPGIGMTDKLWSVTTAKAWKGALMPEGGLKQSMYHREVPLTLRTIQQSPGLNYGGSYAHIARHFIAVAFTKLFPELEEILGKPTGAGSGWHLVDGFPKLPNIDRIPIGKAEHITLDLILENEGSTDGTHRVIENIFNDQFKWDLASLKEALILVYGDQKSYSNVLSVLQELGDEVEGYDRLDQILPIPGLFHFKMALIDGIKGANWGNEKDPKMNRSALSAHAQILNRKKVPATASPFTHTERLVLDSAYSRIGGFLWQSFEGKVDDYHQLKNRQIILNHMKTWTMETFNEYVGVVFNACFTKAVQRPAPDVLEREKKRAKDDTRLTDGTEHKTNHLRFLSGALTYHALTQGIKLGDIGMIKWSIDRSIPFFAARNKHNYANVSLWLKRLTDTTTADTVLQRAILANSLINIRGKADSFIEADRVNELLNLYLRNIITIRRNGSFDVEHQLRLQTLLATFHGELRARLEAELGERTNSRHTTPSLHLDLGHLAHICYITSLNPNGHAARQMPWIAPDLITEGMNRLANGALARFNDRVTQRQGNFSNFAATTDDGPDDEAVEQDPVAAYEARTIMSNLSAHEECGGLIEPLEAGPSVIAAAA